MLIKSLKLCKFQLRFEFSSFNISFCNGANASGIKSFRPLLSFYQTKMPKNTKRSKNKGGKYFIVEKVQCATCNTHISVNFSSFRIF